jgi:hypothetical protein
MWLGKIILSICLLYRPNGRPSSHQSFSDGRQLV